MNLFHIHSITAARFAPMLLVKIKQNLPNSLYFIQQISYTLRFGESRAEESSKIYNGHRLQFAPYTRLINYLTPPLGRILLQKYRLIGPHYIRDPFRRMKGKPRMCSLTVRDRCLFCRS
ncbi:hypothetical protein CDAR_63571 [Caerostris darwini]|uniref:Uncharacterized protein n=1 Tax=Caerostris darwini TaxID=1538125 RepID=A0AAV4QF72_9ARAC|nr:hypothetical protein CDAR_63571 [Caerostris darwini]